MLTAIWLVFTTSIGYLLAKYEVFCVNVYLGSIIGFLVGLILKGGASKLGDLDDYVDTDSFFSSDSSDSCGD